METEPQRERSPKKQPHCKKREQKFTALGRFCLRAGVRMKPIPLAIYLPHFLWFVSSTRIILLGALINISKISVIQDSAWKWSSSSPPYTMAGRNCCLNVLTFLIKKCSYMNYNSTLHCIATHLTASVNSSHELPKCDLGGQLHRRCLPTPPIFLSIPPARLLRRQLIPL